MQKKKKKNKTETKYNDTFGVIIIYFMSLLKQPKRNANHHENDAMHLELFYSDFSLTLAFVRYIFSLLSFSFNFNWLCHMKAAYLAIKVTCIELDKIGIDVYKTR